VRRDRTRGTLRVRVRRVRVRRVRVRRVGVRVRARARVRRVGVRVRTRARERPGRVLSGSRPAARCSVGVENWIWDGLFILSIIIPVICGIIIPAMYSCIQ
jgi:hypothetical protein